MVGGQPWRASNGSGLILFLVMICKSFAEGWTSIWGVKIAYVTYQISLFRNNLIFNTEIMPTHQILERALSLVTKYYSFDTASLPIDAIESWDFHATSAISRRVLFIYWEHSPSRFIKVNFDNSVQDGGVVWALRDGRDGVSFVIHDPDAMFLAMRVFHLLKPSISKVKLHASRYYLHETRATNWKNFY